MTTFGPKSDAQLGQEMSEALVKNGSMGAFLIASNHAAEHAIHNSGIFLELPEDPMGKKVRNLRAILTGAIQELERIRLRVTNETQ
jgi:hypothetical protein